uniref:Uncharacterized protein n=1 Tax=Romanomermis culicivorax TaxID=13658 RepID=A0A915KML3_ROMCU
MEYSLTCHHCLFTSIIKPTIVYRIHHSEIIDLIERMSQIVAVNINGTGQAGNAGQEQNNNDGVEPQKNCELMN